MKQFVQILIAATFCAVATGAIAATQTKCSVAGSWTDKFGAEATFRNNKAGVATDTSLCAKPYRLSVTRLNAKYFDVSASSAKGSCPAFTAALTFEGGCSVASGIVDVSGKGTYHDTWTKSAAVSRRAPMASTALRDGLK